jgi:hypothetical protein
MLYSGYKVCASLDPKDVCFIVEQYHEGRLEVIFHQHIPRSRQSLDSRRNLLKALVLRFLNAHEDSISTHFINDRGNNPSAANFVWDTSYPEPGVIRRSYGQNTRAWFDQVVVKSEFRQSSTALQQTD